MEVETFRGPAAARRLGLIMSLNFMVSESPSGDDADRGHDIRDKVTMARPGPPLEPGSPPPLAPKRVCRKPPRRWNGESTTLATNRPLTAIRSLAGGTPGCALQTGCRQMLGSLENLGLAAAAGGHDASAASRRAHVPVARALAHPLLLQSFASLRDVGRLSTQMDEVPTSVARRKGWRGWRERLRGLRAGAMAPKPQTALSVHPRATITTTTATWTKLQRWDPAMKAHLAHARAFYEIHTRSEICTPEARQHNVQSTIAFRTRHALLGITMLLVGCPVENRKYTKNEERRTKTVPTPPPAPAPPGSRVWRASSSTVTAP
ncbi:hypothetical protein G7046_g8581 [Stylonectria norvegica]|nr:hypothetical protein G7046_g8581 [Stylonectria norvegica]